MFLHSIISFPKFRNSGGQNSWISVCTKDRKFRNSEIPELQSLHSIGPWRVIVRPNSTQNRRNVTLNHLMQSFAPPILTTYNIHEYSYTQIYSTYLCLYYAIRLPTSASSLRPIRPLDGRELFVPRTRTTMAKSRSLLVAGPSLWNRLPPSARTSFLSSNLSTSLALLKTCLFSWSYMKSNQKRLCWPTPVEGRYVNTWIQYNTIQSRLIYYGLNRHRVYEIMEIRWMNSISECRGIHPPYAHEAYCMFSPYFHKIYKCLLLFLLNLPFLLNLRFLLPHILTIYTSCIKILKI